MAWDSVVALVGCWALETTDCSRCCCHSWWAACHVAVSVVGGRRGQGLAVGCVAAVAGVQVVVAGSP